MFSIFAVVVQTVAALLSLAWAPMAASRAYNEKMTIYESARLFIWNIFWFGFRVASFSLLAAYSIPYLVFVILTHIITMVFWLWRDFPGGKVFGGLYTGLFMFYYLTESDSNDLVYFDFFYNIIVSFENAFSIGLFLIDPTLNVTNCVIMLIVLYFGVGGILFVFNSITHKPSVMTYDTTQDTTQDTIFYVIPVPGRTQGPSDTTYITTQDTTSDRAWNRTSPYGVVSEGAIMYETSV